MDGALNFIPKMEYQRLIRGYKEILETIYAPKQYYLRVKSFLKDYTVPLKKTKKISSSDLKAFLKSIWILGVLDKGKRYYWKLLIFSLLKYPEKFSVAVMLTIYGFHFRKVSEAV